MTDVANHPPPTSSPDERNSRCRQWSAEHAHQVAAGKARAAQMTREERIAFGHATFDAFLCLLPGDAGAAAPSAIAAQHYLTSEHIRRLGMPLTPPLAETLCCAWCAGQLLSVSAWLDDDPPPDPVGLWAAI